MVSGWDHGWWLTTMSPYLMNISYDHQPYMLDGTPLTSLCHLSFIYENFCEVKIVGANIFVDQLLIKLYL